MKPSFDENGLAIESGKIRCFYYDAVTGEYSGWSDEFIYVGVSMPGSSTDTAPGDDVVGMVEIFNGQNWEQQEDHRGETAYSTDDGEASKVDYIGPIKDGYTSTAPSTPYDKWDGEKWVTDQDAQHAADVEAAAQHKAVLLAEAQETISLWQTELQLGIISDEGKTNLILWINYIKKLQNIDTSLTSAIEWPSKP